MTGISKHNSCNKNQVSGAFGLLISVMLLVAVMSSGCVNPFAPEEGDLAGDIWDKQTTIGGLLRNFEMAYVMQDSFKYADLLAEEFVFKYFDVELERYDQWYRVTDLQTFGRMVEQFENMDLHWGTPSPAWVDTFSLPDTTIVFRVNFSLDVQQFNPIFGFAQFSVRTGGDGKFRILEWRDDY